MKKPEPATEATTEARPDCFVIMPISEPPGYEAGHFRRVFEDLIAPACEQAGFQAVRADETKQSNVIHLDILKKLLASPLVVCDLSSRNPNVLFELGIRQAFDKPTVLIQEAGTERIFDINILRIVDYRPSLKYREVIADQELIAETITATTKPNADKSSINSIVKLLSLTEAAKLPEASESDTSDLVKLLLDQIGQIRSDMRQVRRQNERLYDAGSNAYRSHVRSGNRAELDTDDFNRSLSRLNDAESLLARADGYISGGGSGEEALKMINHAQERLMLLAKTDSSEEIRRRAAMLFEAATTLERKLSIQ